MKTYPKTMVVKTAGDIGLLIQSVRKARKLTQKELGVKCGFKASTALIRISKYERGLSLMSVETFNKIMDILDVDLEITIRDKKSEKGVDENGKGI